MTELNLDMFGGEQENAQEKSSGSVKKQSKYDVLRKVMKNPASDKAARVNAFKAIAEHTLSNPKKYLVPVKEKKRKQHSWWFDKDTIHHRLDNDLVARIFDRSDDTYQDLFNSDPSFNPHHCVCHTKWSDKDCEILVNGMFEHAMGIIQYAKGNSEAFKEAVDYVQHSPLFEVACKLKGLDIVRMKQGIKHYAERVYKKDFGEVNEKTLTTWEPSHSFFDTMKNGQFESNI